MNEPARRRATYQDLIDLPENVVGEILHGTLFTQPRPSLRHAQVASSMGGSLEHPFRRGQGGPGGWIILDEPELHLGQHVLVPDLAAWRRERVPELPDSAAFDVAPDWVCEVLSPSTRAHDRVEKLPIYAEHEVAYAWLVDPEARTLEAYRREGPSWLLLGTYRDDQEPRVEPFDAIELPMKWLWAR